MERFKDSASTFSNKLFRLKTVGGDFLETELKRCLSTFDITLLGVGHMVGAGVYVLTGAVVRNKAGPGIIVSFILAGFASLLSALCYAEFGARVPKAGSAYTYTYVTVGEFWAFVIGWNILLEHMLVAAAVARSWSGYLDSLLGHVIHKWMDEVLGSEMGGDSHVLGDYPDLVAFATVILVAAFMACGAKSSTNVNTFFTIINMSAMMFVVILGFTFADFSLWTSPVHGGFMPFGFSGVLAGAASCFFAYVGFDSIATAGEEASDPAKSIPRSTIISMAIATLAYILMSAALTLMVPYDQIHPTSAFADAFEQKNVNWAKIIVAVGALSGMTTSLVGSMFALPRCVYAMANDGLIFKFLAAVHPKTQVPSVAVGVFGMITALIALLIDMETLVEFLSIGTLMAYTIVSGSVIILRYQPGGHLHGSIKKSMSMGITAVDQLPVDVDEQDTEGLIDQGNTGKVIKSFTALIPFVERFEPGLVVTWAVLLFSILSSVFLVVITYTPLGAWWSITLLVIFGVLSTGTVFLMYIHEQGKQDLRFKVPLVPLLPCLSIVINIIFMIHLSAMTWIRLSIWLAVGFLIYFGYGISHSVENPETTVAANYGTSITPTSKGIKVPKANPNVTISEPQPNTKMKE